MLTTLIHISYSILYHFIHTFSHFILVFSELHARPTINHIIIHCLPQCVVL